jgi:hypothetical protein
MKRTGCSFVAESRAALRIGLLPLVTVFALGCSDSTSPPPGQSADVGFALANVGGAFPNQTTYIQGLPHLEHESVGIENATEIESGASMWRFNGAVYMTTFGAPATMSRYVFDDRGVAVKQAAMVTPGANTYSTVQFVSPTEAYASVAGGLAKLVKFDPTDMRTTGEVDLLPLERPEANSLWYIGSHVRDGKLFLAVEYQQNFQTVFDSAFVAVIDLDSGELEKVISDGRTAMIFAPGSAVLGFVEDANGDIYVNAMGAETMHGYRPSGILRIPAGETEFDPAYFLNLDDELGNPGYGLRHFPEEDITFTWRVEDPSDPWEFDGPNYRLWRIDLRTGSAIGPVEGLPLTYGSSSAIARQFEPGTIHIAVAGAEEDAVYVYDTASHTAARAFAMTGGRTSGFDRLD